MNIYKGIFTSQLWELLTWVNFLKLVPIMNKVDMKTIGRRMFLSKCSSRSLLGTMKYLDTNTLLHFLSTFLI